MGVLVVTLIVTVVISASVVSALGFTTATRADVQSQAAAEAGIAVAQASLMSGTCAADVDTIEDIDGDGFHEAVFRGTNPEFTTVVKSWSGASPINGCPGSTATRVLVSGLGLAATPGLIARGNSVTVEAEFTAPAAPITTEPSGPAVYSGGGSAFNAMTITSATGVPADIRILNGDFTCTTTSYIEGTVIVANGNVHITNTCTIRGDLIVSGTVNITSGVTIEGDVIAAGGGVTLSNSTISVGGSVYANGKATIHGQIEGSVDATGAAETNGGSRIKGDLKAGGQIEVRGRVDGDVTTPSTAAFKFNPNSGYIVGNAVFGGNIDTWGEVWNEPSEHATLNEKRAYSLKKNGKIGGTIRYLDTSSAAPEAKPAPVVPPWVDFEYHADDWTDFNVIVWDSSKGCQVEKKHQTQHPSYHAVLSATTPTLVDTRACGTVNINGSNGNDLVVKTDIAFIGKGFTLGNGADVKSGNGENHYVWFLVPDGNPSAAGPNCSNGAGNISTNGAVIIHEEIIALAYTPCTIALNNGTAWRGQLYSGTITVSSSDSLQYSPIGIPGWDLDGETVVVPPTEAGGMFDTPTSQRNVSQ
ncbi:MAG TPA: polymer-forming cytoskeletal protein [Terrimesophilobacter sp.]|nr:polymer-forming cytoskeletal protein [Terrimesophilobacter sp.]